jgi:hypothetical protein
METIPIPSAPIIPIQPIPFTGFPKITRLNREIIVTEKCDGTNAQIRIEQDGTFLVGSRTRWISPGDDNYGFAKWAYANKEELMKLGPGSHFGEWWGLGINRNYGLKEKRFSLFNTFRWADTPGFTPGVDLATRPACVSCVPILYQGMFRTNDVAAVIEDLKAHGSRLVPGWMKPEGVVVFHIASNHLYKVTVDNDQQAKGQV